ncbi:TPA: discoidin domain-containing protein [Streptococcus suis]
MNRLNRKYQYSIRKTTFGVGSVVVGVMLAGMLHAPSVLANTISDQTTTNLANQNSNEVSVEEHTGELATDNASTENLTVEREPEFAVAEGNDNAQVETTEVRVPVDLTYNGAKSNETGHPATAAYDDNEKTYWTSDPVAANHNTAENPQHLITKLVEPALVSRIEYTPRQAPGANDVTGNIDQLSIYHSLNGVEWELANPTSVDNGRGTVNSDKSVSFVKNQMTKIINITPVNAQYFKLVASRTQHWEAANRNKMVTAADFIPRGTKQVPTNELVGIASATATSFNPNDGGARPASAAIDGNANTYWVSASDQNNSLESSRQQLTVTLNEPAIVSVVEYLPRQNGGSAVGNIISGYIEYRESDDTNEEWKRVRLLGEPANNVFTLGTSVHRKDIQFEEVIAKQLRLTALETHHWQTENRNKIVAVGEFKPIAYKIPDLVEEDRPSTETPVPVPPTGDRPAPDTTTPTNPVVQPETPPTTPVVTPTPVPDTTTPANPVVQPETPPTTPVVQPNTTNTVTSAVVREINLSNEFINRKMEIRDGKLRTLAIENKMTEASDDIEFLEGSKEFIIQFKPGQNAPTAPTLPDYLAESDDRSSWIARTNSSANVGVEGPIAKALDGNLISRWHSNYHGGGNGSIGTPNSLPAHAEFEFSTPKDIRTFIYVPRQDGADNGVVKDYKIYIKQGEATDYTEIVAGSITENPKQTQFIDLGDLKTGVKAIKFEVLRAVNNQPFAAAAEFDVSSRTAAEIRAAHEARRAEYIRQVEAYQSQFQISLDKLTVAENGVEEQTDADGKTITFTFNPIQYQQVPVTIKYVVNLKNDAKFSQSHLLISVPEEHKSSLTIDTIDLQSYKLKADQAYTEFSKQAPISEMSGFRGFYAGLGQPVYMGSFYSGSEFPTAWNSVDEDRKLFSRYYSGKTFAQLETDASGQFRTWNTVFGVARSDDYSVVQQDFYDYLAKIGQDTYFRKQYNSWFDHMKDITAENIQSSFNEIERGFTEGGVSPLHSYVVDDGWQTVDSFWDFNNKFPNKLYDSSKQVKRFGSDFGLWLGPQGGYGNPGVMANHLAQTNQGSSHAGVVYIGDKRYTDGLTNLFANYDKEFDINYWKLDGLLLNPKGTSDQYGIGGGYQNMYSMTETHERWIKLYETIREHATDPDKMWINLTSYIPPSPWFLQWVNSIWMQNAADVDYQDGVKKEGYRHLDFGGDAAEAITYRDDRYEELVKLRKWQLPFANIYNHDPVYGNTANSTKKLHPTDRNQRPKINFTTDELRTYLYMLGTRGTGFWEFYYSSSMMDDAKWQVNGEAVKWIEANYETLKHAVFHGGKPGHGEVYGYSAWDENNGIVSIRNPINEAKTYTLKLDRIVGMREGTKDMYRTTVLGEKRHDTTDLTKYGDSITITLQPYETVIFQYSKERDTVAAKVLTAKANDARTISLEFDERVVLDENSRFTVSGHTVTATSLNPNLRTVTLTLGEDLTNRENVTVSYEKVKDNAAQANLAAGSIALTAYDKGVIEDISHVDKSLVLENAGVAGKGVFSVTAKANLAKLDQTIAEQEGQWRLFVDADGKVVFDVKGLQVKSAPFSRLKEGDRGQADSLVSVGRDVTITAVRTANGSLKLYLDGQLHNSNFDASKVNEELSLAKLKVTSPTFEGTVSRFVLENFARDFETAASLKEEITPTTRLVSAPLDTSLSAATSFDPNDSGEHPAGLATDGNPNTYWVSLPSKDNRNEKQTLVVAMQNQQLVSEVRHTPRQAAAKAVGNVKRAYLEHSVDGTNWQRVQITNGNDDNTITFPVSTATSSIQFTPVNTKYFRLTALETYHWQDGQGGRENSLNKVVAVAELTPVVLYVPEKVERLTTAYLRNAIEQAKALDSSAYTSDSYAKVQALLPSSEAGLTADTQGVIDNANTALRTALAQLVPVGEASSRTLTDAATGVRLDLQANELDSIIGLQVTHKEGIVNVPDALADKDYDLFDIVLVDETGHKIANTLPVRVSLPVDAGKKVENVLYLPTAGDKVELPFTESVRVTADGSTRKEVTFTANNFSDYAIVYSDTATTTSFIDWFATEVGDLDGDKDVDKADVQLWLKGAKGDKGEKGDTGATGAKGDTGATGPAGVAGPKGDTGATGPAGVAGPKGDTGATGPAGVASPKGDTGATGPAGVAGPKGDTGATGPAGVVGPKGDTGATGPAGVAGPKGDTGATGPVGPQGPQGETSTTATTPFEEELITAKGESLLQPALPEFDGGIVPNVAPTAEVLPLGVLPEEEIITAKGESVKAPALPKLDLSAIKASHAPALAQAEAKKEEKASLPNTGAEAELALTALGMIGLLATSRLVSRRRY